MVYHILIGKPIVNKNSIGKPKKLKKIIFFKKSRDSARLIKGL